MARAAKTLVLLILAGVSTQALGLSSDKQLLVAQELYRKGQYYQSARFAFAALEDENRSDSADAEAYAWITLSLVRSGLYHSASYFFIRTLQMEKAGATQKVLKDAEELLVRVGVDLFRNYLIRHTKDRDYDQNNRSAYHHALGKATLLAGKYDLALDHFEKVSRTSSLWPMTLQMRGTIRALKRQNDQALEDFQACVDRAPSTREGRDLRARCQAGLARTYYQAERFQEADRAYDQIAKTSYSWPDSLFEQAWNSFAKKEYNRALGKLVTYKSPAIRFVYNSEIDVLRAQSYFALCLYGEVNQVLDEFQSKFSGVGLTMKRFLEGKNLDQIYAEGKRAAQGPLDTKNELHKVLNRFVRAPYFDTLVRSERAVRAEEVAIPRFEGKMAGYGEQENMLGSGLSGFLKLVLNWREDSIQKLGGMFVKNSLLDYYEILISDIEKMKFIKLEMIGRAKEKLLGSERKLSDRLLGNETPARRDDQFYWSFNGEFWNDELGDYVFGLESQCGS